MTWVDLVVLAVLAISALLAFVRGLVREVLGLAAWVGAVAAAVWALPYARPRFQEWLGASPWVDLVAFGVVLLVTLIVLLIISRWIGALVRASPIGGIDRTHVRAVFLGSTDKSRISKMHVLDRNVSAVLK